jgi:hypothetical protein
VVCWIERAVLFLAVLYLCLHTLPRAWRTLNTDFPNYYMSARLVHEGYDTSRMYEWPWIEREKDHRDVDIRVIGLLPITPFSTLAIWPLASLAPIAAKHVWILLNLAFLIPIGWMLRSLTGLSYRRIALALSLSFPLHRNLLYGQFYVLLLLLIVAACWSYLRGFRSIAGALLAIAAVCKIFPVLLFVFFLQRRDWRALASGVLAGLAAVALSIAAFGWNVHRTWLEQILPWVMHGEGMPPYTVSSASFSSLLHRLFLYEPQWNSNPWHASPLCYALLLPLLQVVTLAPAILLIQRDDRSRTRVLLEWSALLTASLAISTIPASYNFVLMIFPVCVVSAILLARKEYGWLVVVVVAYLGIGFPVPDPHGVSGLAVLLYMPRLPLMLTMLLAIYRLMWRGLPENGFAWDWTRYAWGAAMVASVAWSVPSTFHLQRAERQELAYRVPLQVRGFLDASPQPAGTGVRYAAFTMNGYQLVTQDRKGVSLDPPDNASYDDLSFTAGSSGVFVERARSGNSKIVDVQAPSSPVIENGRDPMPSADGRDLAFIRDEDGRGRLMIRREVHSPNPTDVVLTPARFNVYEASFISEKEYAFSATENGGSPRIVLTDMTHSNTPLALGEARYPALSPDAQWMAYSHLDQGVWNLWVRNQQTGKVRRIADLPCNQIQPAWEADSKTLLYGTDCARSLWFTAVARRQVIP